MTKVQMRDICQFNEGVGCTRYAWQRGSMCLRCGWCPAVFEARKRQTREKLAAERENVPMSEIKERELLKEGLRMFQELIEKQKSTGNNGFSVV